jgi:hypothetical protein
MSQRSVFVTNSSETHSFQVLWLNKSSVTHRGCQ